MLWLYILLGIILALLLICVIRALACKKNERPALPADEKRGMVYAEKLGRMIRCQTVSVRGEKDRTKFYAFHKEMEALFPLVHEKLEKTELDGCLIFRWKGRGEAKPVMLLGHMDTVDADPEGWIYPPFGGEIHDGAVWGRGAMDTKCSVLGFFQAAEELLKEGFTPAGDVYLASGCTEEVAGEGAPGMAAWLKTNGIKLGMLMDEGGGVIDNAMAGLPGVYAMIALGEKGYGDFSFTAKSAGGHSSTPPKNTPLVRLSRFILSCEKHSPFKAKLTKSVRGTFEAAAPNVSFWMKLIFCNLWLFGPLFKLLLPAINPNGEALMQTTIAFTMASGSNGFNVLPQKASVVGNLRFIPHQNMDESISIITKRAAKYGVETEFLHGNPASPILSTDSAAYKLIAGLVSEHFPQAVVSPFLSVGGTDARYFTEVAEQTVRFAPIVLNKQQYQSMHAINENMSVLNIPFTVDFYKSVIRNAAF